MPDPAKKAVNLALAKHWEIVDSAIQPYLPVLNDVAREALRPLRELHRRTDMPHWSPWCLPCKTTWPCATARLVYTSEELAESGDTHG